LATSAEDYIPEEGYLPQPLITRGLSLIQEAYAQ
jgi:hypothetical protein